MAAIVLKSGEKATEEEIIAFTKERLADYKVPRAVIFVDSIPRWVEDFKTGFKREIWRFPLQVKA